MNEKLWLTIQEVNLATNYNLPYINLRRVETAEGDKLRVIISPYDIDNDKSAPQYIDENTSHIARLKQLSPQKIIQLGNMKGSGRAEILADETSQISAVVDIFLDIAMFNSISFLTILKDNKRREFNDIKFKYFIDHGYDKDSYFYINPDNQPTYISFAFAHHLEYNKLDYCGYINCWEEFLDEYYNGNINHNIPAVGQLKKHVDYYNIDKQFKTNEFWSNYQPGSYLFLRTNQCPNTTDRQKRMLRYFGQPSYHIGISKVVPLQPFHMMYLENELKELNISAFKIVID
jgi:hypothetical protein